MISPIHRRVTWPLKRDSMDIILGFTKVLYQGQTDESVLVIINLFSSHALFFFDSCHFSAFNPHVICHSKVFLRRFLQIVVGVFGNDLIQYFTHNLHSSIAFSVTGRHQSNGKAERFGRTFQDYLRFYVGSNTSWYVFLTFSNVTINSTPSLWKQHIVPD